MQEFNIGGSKKLCFLVKKATADKGKDIVVPYDSLADIDRKRFFEMERQGGELMRVMRDTTLDNGNNALVQYADILIDVETPTKAKTTAKKVEAAVVNDAVTEPTVRKSRGRPAGSKNKAKS